MIRIGKRHLVSSVLGYLSYLLQQVDLTMHMKLVWADFKKC